MPASEQENQWRVSSGTAAVLGLCSLRMEAAPTTAYLMLGERCARNCAFCTQARASHAHAAALSRVIWPLFPEDQVVAALARAHREGSIRRACFQVTISRGYLEQSERAVSTLARACEIPICVSVAPRNPEDVGRLLAAGAQRVTIALDAACERVYDRVKGGSWAQTLSLLTECAALYPGHISTHLIVGLGETEREMAEIMQRLHDLGVTIGLFSFTPVAGTALADCSSPDLLHYRRMQAAHWLITGDLARAEAFGYNSQGQLVNYGMSPDRLRELLAEGTAFRTSGCPDCNRPYYNEHPGGPLYNYPRPLTRQETDREIDALLDTLDG
ncbi:MAG: radical SAM protein [Chloroflexi bacterium]|nr:radical SAM protein [Chloroflexota bacterium]